jgi:glucan 1,3-beta-glucosidase
MVLLDLEDRPKCHRQQPTLTPMVIQARPRQRLDPNRPTRFYRTSLPFIHYRLSLTFSPKGHCASLGIPQDAPFDGTYEAYQTGGPGASGSINAADLSNYPWPPKSIGLVSNAALLPTYTATGPVPTLPTPTFPAPTDGAKAVAGGDGWFNAGDTAMGIVTVAGCSYPNAWNATAVPVPTALCTGTPARKRELVPFPVITPV